MYLRFHHIGQLVELNTQYKNWTPTHFSQEEVVPFADLYRHKEVGAKFLEFEGDKMRKSYRNMVRAGSREVPWWEYVGRQGEFIDEYARARIDICRTLLNTIPQRPISLGHHQDAMCVSCQLKTPGQPYGDHCSANYGSHLDYIYERAIHILEDPGNLVKTANPIPEYQTTIGFLRALTSSNALGRAVSEAKKEFDFLKESMFHEGSLYIAGDYLKVNFENMAHGKERR